MVKAMRSVARPSKPEELKKYQLKSAIINGYEYTKTYYRMENGVPVKSDVGSDGDLTVVHISRPTEASKPRRAFIFSEGYIGAERSYNDDGTKRKSVAKKNCFGIEYLIKYIENGEKYADDFYVVFLSDKEKSENQADLFAQVIQDVSSEKNKSTYMWCHSKSGLLALRALQKLREAGNAEGILKKVKAIITSMPTKGLDSVNRPRMINNLNNNKILNVLPFSGFMKAAILKIYDKYLYKPTPAQVDLKAPEQQDSKIEEHALLVEPTGARRIWDKIMGKEAFRKQVRQEKQVDSDMGYVGRVMSDENMDKITDVKFKVLPVEVNFKDALESLVKHAQLMPFILYTKKILTSRGRGDGIITMDNQGIDNEKLKFQKDIVVHATHDIPTTPEALKTVSNELVKDDDGDKEL
jgi:hypothetical protein